MRTLLDISYERNVFLKKKNYITELKYSYDYLYYKIKKNEEGKPRLMCVF